MKTIGIVFTEAYKAEVLQIECRSPGYDEVMVELEYSAISAGTERENFVGGRVSIYYSEGVTATFPRCVGYSSAGIVKEVGEGVTELKVGDRVAIFGSKHQKHITINKSNVIKLSAEVSTAEAAMSYISIFPLAAIRKTKLEIGESALVMGLGILGIFAVEELRAAGAYPIIAVDPIKERRDFALKMGADYAFDPTDASFSERVNQITDGGVNVCIEVTGLGIGLIQALDCMKKMGRVALLGCTRSSKFEIDYYSKVHGRGISIIGAHTLARPQNESSSGFWTEKDDIKTILNLIKSNRLNFKDIICEIHSPADAQTIYDRLVNEKNFPIGVLFDWGRI